MAVLKISFPVILLDETLKLIARKFTDGTRLVIESLQLAAFIVGYISLVVYNVI